MIASVATNAAEEQIFDIVYLCRINRGDRIFSIVVLTELLLLLRRQAFPERLRHWTLLSAHGTVTLVRTQAIFGMGNTKTTTALKNKLIICNLNDEMISGCARPHANLMIRICASLTEDQRTLFIIISRDTTNIASIDMVKPEWIV